MTNFNIATAAAAGLQVIHGGLIGFSQLEVLGHASPYSCRCFLFSMTL